MRRSRPDLAARNRAPYSPETCRWALPSEQAKNRRNTRRITWRGETLCLEDWARRIGLTHQAIEYRLKAGWSLDAALSGERHAHRRHAQAH